MAKLKRHMGLNRYKGTMSRHILWINTLLAFNVGACSLAPALEEFIVTEGAAVTVINPNFSVDSIHRGNDDGKRNSCSDLGFINLQLESVPSHAQGYIFNIVEGDFGTQIFNNVPVVPSKFMGSKKQYTFHWFERNNTEQKPINMILQIIAVSRTGDKSEAQLLTITHP